MPDLESLQDLLGVAFTDVQLLQEALTHESYTHEHGLDCSNERLEFLGDAVVGAVVSAYLFESYPARREGQLTRMKSLVVSSEFLAQQASELGLGEFMVLGKGEEGSGGRSRPSVLADAMEAVIGAIFLDQGFEAARRFVLRLFGTSLRDLPDTGKDYKGELQEKTQRLYRELPEYAVVREDGPPHSRSFSVEVNLGETRLGTGVGSSKKQAQQAAAQQALEHLESQAGDPDEPIG